MSGGTNAVSRMYADTRFGQSHLYMAGDRGSAIAPPLVCFHMSPWSALVFEPFLKAMAPTRFSIAVDSPGYGNSDVPPGQPTVADYAGAMLDVLDRLGLERIHLLGDRTGAKIAFEVARLRPSQVQRLVLISPVIWTDVQREQRLQYPLESVNKDGSHLTALWRLSVGLGMWGGRSLDQLAEVFYARVQRQDIAHFARRAAAEYDAREALQRFERPVLILNPKDDLWDTTPRAKPFLTHAQSRVLDLPDWGYGFIEVKADEVATIVNEFLDAP